MSLIQSLRIGKGFLIPKHSNHYLYQTLLKSEAKRSYASPTPWLTERHGYDPTSRSEKKVEREYKINLYSFNEPYSKFENRKRILNP